MVFICYGSGLYGGKKVTNPKLYIIEMSCIFFQNQLYQKRKKMLSTISSWEEKGSGENRNVNSISGEGGGAKIHAHE